MSDTGTVISIRNLVKTYVVGEVEVRLVWDPPWTKDRMSEDAKLALDIF